MNFKEYIKETSLFSNYRKLGWWKDTPTYFFHGTREGILDKIKKDGGLIPTQTETGYDKVHGKVFMALDPYTARGYSVMGGEYQFKLQRHPKPEKYGRRVVLVFKYDNINQFIPSGQRRNLLTNYELYDKFISENGENMAWKYYERSEVYSNEAVTLDHLVEVVKL